MSRKYTLKELAKMSALRQSMLLALVFLFLHFLGALIIDNLVRRDFDNQVSLELQSRFNAIASDIKIRGFQRNDYPISGTVVVYYQSDAPSQVVAPEGIFERTGDFELEPFQLSRLRWGEEWQYYAGDVNGQKLVVGVNLVLRTHFLSVIARTIVIVGAIIAAVTLGIGAFLGLRTQRRLNRISQVLEHVASGRLDRRVNTRKELDDLDVLGHRIDQTIDRLDIVLRQSRDFATNIAHDLKTPLARLRLRLEQVIISQAEDKIESVETIEALQQCDQIIAVIDAFLRIARLESGTIRNRFEPVDITDLAEEVFSTFEPVAEDTGYELILDASDPVTVKGDRVLLYQLLVNLIENALKHTPKGSKITLVANARTLGVADTGPGIPPEAYSEVIKPSVRLDRSRSDSGAGLGLALVKTIADLHDASLILSPNPGLENSGLFIRIEFSP